ncbi:aldehyde dehydrogenase family protein [Aminiphilus sp.]|uniref:aldehyde dehydrogenase family protein n=1 Tax=Aminiphilus sp. TaxID=1872488 RepID=UPI00260398DC|nr:aldehyde dehydrogenase family protein [Aminiphilus sp.]
MIETVELPSLVARVMAELKKRDVSGSLSGNVASSAVESVSIPTGSGSEVDRSVAAAVLAQEHRHREYDIRRRTNIIARLREDMTRHVEELARFSLEETGMGNLKDKKAKILLAIEKTPGPEYFATKAVSGDNGLMLEELSPFGVIASLCPSTNPVATVINNTICMLAAGNAVVFGPHPGALRSTLRTVELVNLSLRDNGAPFGLVSALSEVSLEAMNALMTHGNVRLISATGGPGVVKAALSSGKPTVGAGPGNPPVLVDETADIEKAAKDIIAGCSFDNNLPCIAEKELLVVNCVADKLKRCMTENGAFEISDPALIRKLETTVLTEQGTVNKAFVGKDASHILERIGVAAPEGVRLILVETDESHPFAQEELLMPLLPMIRVPDFDAGLTAAKRLEHGFRHSACIHSNHVKRLSDMAREMETTMFVKNAPSYAAIGVDSDAPTAFTIATTTGQGATTPLSFCRTRRCVLSGAFRIV